MRFAINYSPQAEQLLSEGRIDIDFFKCSPDFPELIPRARTLRPVIAHFSLHAGGPDPAEYDMKQIEDILKQTDTETINLHLQATQEEYPDIDVTSEDDADRQRVALDMIRDVRRITEHFGKQPVMLENFPYFAAARHSHDILRACVEPSVISQVIEETGVFLLLDIDHARAAAHYMDISLEAYIAALPADRIRELHMTGSVMEDGVLKSHLPMSEEDWKIFDWALEQIRKGQWSHPPIFAFEYGGVGPLFEWRSDKDVIEQQVPIFMQKVAKLGD